jgi:uncharacterized glyoxalase superfamily protein PhnB
MVTGGGLIMLATRTDEYESPRTHRTRCERASSWSQTPYIVDGVLVYIDDVDAHHARARSAGAVILSPPEDGEGGRRHRAEDASPGAR